MHLCVLSSLKLISCLHTDDSKNQNISLRYSDNNKHKLMTLPVVEFIRRFLLHVLPAGFMRIRHFGLFSNRGRTERINGCRKQLGEKVIIRKDKKESWWEQILERTGNNPLICPQCHNGLLTLRMILPPRRFTMLMT